MNPEILEIDGSIVNLCVAQGMDAQAAAKMLAGIIRIYRKPVTAPLNKRLTNACQEFEIVTRKDDPRINAARRRIQRMEEMIKAARHGNLQSQNRKKWRREKGDSECIIKTLAHVLSSDRPIAPDDIWEDARLLLVRTGEIVTPQMGWGSPPPSWNGAPGLSLNLEGNRLKLAAMKAGSASISQQSLGRIHLDLPEETPESIVTAITGSIGGPANSIIQWKGLSGWHDATILDAFRQADWRSSTGIVRICVDTGVLRCDRKSGEIRMERTIEWTRNAA